MRPTRSVVDTPWVRLHSLGTETTTQVSWSSQLTPSEGRRPSTVLYMARLLLTALGLE